MNLKNLRKYKEGIVKTHWCFQKPKNKNTPPKFKKIKSKTGPEIFSLIITKNGNHSSERKITIITNNSLSIYFSYDSESTLNFGKEFTKDDYFNGSILYPDLPTPEELKEIRKYYKKNHKNHQIFITID